MMQRTRVILVLAVLVGALATFAITAQGAVPETTGVEKVSSAVGGGDADGESRLAWITPDGRYGVFYSWATNLVAGDANGVQDVFMRDFQSQTTTLVSQSTAGAQGNGPSTVWDISDDGRYVVFQSYSFNLVPGDTNGTQDVFLRDLASGTTTLVSQSTAGVQANDGSSNANVSNDGRYVYFLSDADNLAPGDTPFTADMFVRDMVTGTTTRITDSGSGTPEPPSIISRPGNPSISDDGRYIAFEATYDVMDDGLGGGLFVFDSSLNTTERVDVTIDSTNTTGPSYFPFISGDGRYVTFHSQADNLVPGDTNGTGTSGKDCFVRDLVLGETSRVSVASGGGQSNGESRWTSISDDGRFVCFYSYASNLVPGDTNGVADIFVHDRVADRTARIGSVQGDGDSETPHMSGDGSRVIFHSAATNLVGGDGNGVLDIFMADVSWDEEATTLAGSDRFGTAVQISQAAFEDSSTVDTVLITTGYNWPDALGGAALAGAVDGPILMVRQDSIPADVLAEIRRLDPSRAIILGGEGVVGAAVFSALEAEVGTGNVARLGGADRFATSSIIASEAVAELGGGFDGTVYVATGNDFPDALGASPIAAAQGRPIFVVGSTLDNATRDAMTAIGVTDVIVLGGTAAVPQAVETALGAEFGASHVSRIAGANRYETAAAIAAGGVEHASMRWDAVALATGENFPDALTGGVLQAQTRSVMLLTPGSRLTASTKAKLVDNKDAIWEIRFLGGTSAISSSVRTEAFGAID